MTSELKAAVERLTKDADRLAGGDPWQERHAADLKAILASLQAPRLGEGELREKVARIIDPLAWDLHAEVMRTAGLDPTDAPPPGLVSDAASLSQTRMALSASKADDILKLMER